NGNGGRACAMPWRPDRRAGRRTVRPGPYGGRGRLLRRVKRRAPANRSRDHGLCQAIQRDSIAREKELRSGFIPTRGISEGWSRGRFGLVLRPLLIALLPNLIAAGSTVDYVVMGAAGNNDVVACAAGQGGDAGAAPDAVVA